MKRKTVLAIVLLATIATCLALNSRAVRIQYHLKRMQAVHDEIHAEPSTISPEGFAGYGSKELFDLHDHHRDRLVALGYYFHATYQMENVPDSVEGVHRVLWQRVVASFPDNPHTTLSVPDNILNVWDAPSRRADWDAFVKKHNVPDFEEQLLSGKTE